MRVHYLDHMIVISLSAEQILIYKYLPGTQRFGDSVNYYIRHYSPYTPCIGPFDPSMVLNERLDLKTNLQSGFRLKKILHKVLQLFFYWGVI